MRMSTKSRFAVQAMIDLALRERSGPVALAQVAARQGVSLSYLEQLFSRLRRAGLVESTRGPGGGYTLGRRPADISAADIVEAVEDPVPAGEDHDGRMQLTRELWSDLDTVLLRHLATVPLSQLVEEQRARGVAVEPTTPRRAVGPAPLVRPSRPQAPNSVFAFGQSFLARG
ncbi:MAG: Rrf2 family transcriptional regulator [Rubrivivax sp.]|nr:Rrf2 family transcriptional regulator [Rubrivivax sp.]